MENLLCATLLLVTGARAVRLHQQFGLMEMFSPAPLPALSEGSSIPVHAGGGAGHIRDTESSALQILRIIQKSP